jgi:hypothetical protein
MRCVRIYDSRYWRTEREAEEIGVPELARTMEVGVTKKILDEKEIVKGTFRERHKSAATCRYHCLDHEQQPESRERQELVYGQGARFMHSNERWCKHKQDKMIDIPTGRPPHLHLGPETISPQRLQKPIRN